MEPLLLARLQFAITTVYHFFFVPLTLGLSLLVAVMQSLWVRTGDETWKRMTRFWGKLFLINFAIGVVTGIVQEFHFGMNWSEYSRFVGDVFGAPLAIEALVAFFVESTFLGVWIFGWDRISRRAHLAAIWLVAVAATVSAFWILVANSFMQHPVGYAVRNGRAELTDFAAVVLNPHVWHQFPHVFFAGLATAAFFMLGISAWHLRRGSEPGFFGRSFRIGAGVAVVSSVLVALIGHAQAQYMVRTQPMKMAAAEALWNSENPAGLSIFAIFDEEKREDLVSIRLPYALSVLAYDRLEGEVKGVNQLQAEYEKLHGPGDYVPPVTLAYWSFRVMVGAGGLMVLLAFFALLHERLGNGARRRKRRLYGVLVWAIALPYLANTCGWLLTEVGRFPWAVQGLFTLKQGVSPTVTVAMLLLSLVGYTGVYGALIAVTVWLLHKVAVAGPASSEQAPSPAAGPSLPLVDE